MEELQNCIPEMRYLYKYIRFKDRANYVKYGSKTLFSCLIKVGLNLMFANKNGLVLSPKQVKTLKRYKKTIIKMVSSDNEKVQQRCLSNKLIDIMLGILLSVISDV